MALSAQTSSGVPFSCARFFSGIPLLPPRARIRPATCMLAAIYTQSKAIYIYKLKNISLHRCRSHVSVSFTTLAIKSERMLGVPLSPKRQSITRTPVRAGRETTFDTRWQHLPESKIQKFRQHLKIPLGVRQNGLFKRFAQLVEAAVKVIIR